MRPIQYNAEFELIGVPPAVVALAGQRAGIDNMPYATRLCAVFERYGSETLDVRGGEDEIMRQMEAWCDTGDSLRTETDLLHPEGADLFKEPIYDIFE